MATITYNPAETLQEAEEQVFGKKPPVSTNAQKSEEEISQVASQQRGITEAQNQEAVSCGGSQKQVIGDSEQDLTTVSTNIQIISGEPYKENRPKTSAFGELPPSNKVRMPADFRARGNVFAHSLIVSRFELMNREWMQFANSLLRSGEKIVSVKKDETGNTQVDRVENIKISSCYRPGPSDSSWAYRWILNKNQHKAKLQGEANANPSQFVGIRSENEKVVDLSRSELHRRFKRRFKNTKPSTIADKEYLFDGYLIDRYGSKQRGRRFLAFISVHNSGLAFDVRSNGLISKKATTKYQKNTTLFKWMRENAHKYGFTPYKREPWHWELLPTRESYFSSIDYVQDKNYNVRVVEQGVLTGLSTSKRDEVLNKREDDIKQPQQYSFLKEFEKTSQGVA